MKSYSEKVSLAKKKSIVYRGVRFYKCGETYLCYEGDLNCEFPFDRICDDFSTEETKKRIDELHNCNDGDSYFKRFFIEQIGSRVREIENQIQTLTNEKYRLILLSRGIVL